MSKERLALRKGLSLASLRIAKDEVVVRGIARFGHGGEGDLSFCDRDPGTIPAAPGSIVLCTSEISSLLAERHAGVRWLAVPDPRSQFIDLCRRLEAEGAIDITDAIERPFGVHPRARIGQHAAIHAEARIDEGANVGAGCVIHRGAWIRRGVVVRDGAVIGCEGINAHRGLDGRQRGFAHLAGVIVGEGTEIGASTVIVRGILTSTRIGAGSVIGNLCNIGHGVEIGQGVWMSVGCLVGGHTTIGERATIAMGAAVRDNLRIGAGAQVGMGSVVVRPVADGESVFGNPARAVPPLSAGPSR